MSKTTGFDLTELIFCWNDFLLFWIKKMNEIIEQGWRLKNEWIIKMVMLFG